MSISNELCVNFLDNQQLDLISTIENNKYKFSFDRIFDPKVSQKEIFEDAARPIVNSILEGFNGTILAYGQTASGKTYTMQGDLDFPDEEGIIPRTINMLFESIMNSPEEIEFTVKTSMLEIYMEKIRDLIDLSRINLNIREDKAKGIYIEDISEYYVSCEEEILELIKMGSENRIQAATNMNENSSRSHSIFIINIHQQNNKDGSAKNSKLVLVDLAGSEKISKTGATGLTLEEAKTINKSLTTLGMVINSLTDGKSTHIPYRESKLTRVLQESLGGNSKTCLIVTCSPSIYNEAETLSTLRFGHRAKNIKNKPKINKELTVGELQNIVDSLEKKLAVAIERISFLEKYILNKGLEIPKDKGLYDKILRETNKEKTLTNINIINNKNAIDETINTLLNYDEFIKLDKLNSEFKIERVNDDEYENTLVSEVKNNISNNNNLLLDKEKKNLQLEYINNNTSIKQDIEGLNKLLIEDKDLSKEQVSLIHQMQGIIKENEDAITKLKENQETIIKTNDLLKTQILEIKTFSSNMMAKTGDLNVNQSNSNLIEKCNRIIQEAKGKSTLIESNKNHQEIEELKKELKKSENEKKFILKALEEKSEKIAQQELEIKEFMDMVKILDNKISPEDKNYAKKNMILEKNLEQMNHMYQQIVTQKGVVKCENQILNKKIKQRNDRISLLEKEIAELKDSVSEKYFNKIKKLLFLFILFMNS